jgi:hypothetical protein
MTSRKNDINKIVFHSVEDLAAGHQLRKGENILRSIIKDEYTDINEIFELYNIKKFFDNGVTLVDWTEDDLEEFKVKTEKFGEIVSKFLTKIRPEEIKVYYEKLLMNYIHSFWEVFNNQKFYKKINRGDFVDLIEQEPYLISEILIHKEIVGYFDKELTELMLKHVVSAEILLSKYEVKDDFKKNNCFLPKGLSIELKEKLISLYLDSEDVNYNYLEIIQNARNRSDFKVSDKLRLKAKRLHEKKTKEFFSKSSGTNFGVSVAFPENLENIKDGFIDEDGTFCLRYNINFIRQNREPYSLFKNFKYLFEYIDNQNRIELVSRQSQIGVIERVVGVKSVNEYFCGTQFQINEMASQAQIFLYGKVLQELGINLESILKSVFTKDFKKIYGFDDQANFECSKSDSFLEKVRFIAPEFESCLKQYKLFVEEGEIEHELLNMSSTPCVLSDIPSLNSNKYIYFNTENQDYFNISRLLFSDQTLLYYVEPFKEKKYGTFFNLMANEKVLFENYEDHQKPRLDYLLDKKIIRIDDSGFIVFENILRVLILKDLFEYEVGSYYHYPLDFQMETLQMEKENIITLESSLFSKPEQSFFNYYLNKKEFTNGLDLRNSYLHGTQVKSEKSEIHQNSYLVYLKLMFLTLLKMDDDLEIHKKQTELNKID